MPKIIRHVDKFETLNFAGYDYQLNAVKVLTDIEYGACFFEQGLGKTKVAIDLTIEWLNTKKLDTVIIFTKKHLVCNWIDEFSIHSSLKPVILTQKQGDNYYIFNSLVKVIIAHYEVANKEAERLKLFGIARDVAVILDESQKLKNPNSRIARTFHGIRESFKKRVILTGTPAANRPYDIWSQIYFLDGGKSLGKDFVDFKNRTDISNNNLNTSNKLSYQAFLDSIFDKIRSFSIRETKSKCGLELPNKTINNVLCQMESNQNLIYQRAINELVVYKDDFRIVSIDNLDSILKRMLRLVQICCNPVLITKDYDFEPGKIEYLHKISQGIKSRNQKVIVWTNFIDNCGYLKRQLHYLSPVIYHGRMSYEDRQNSLDKFKSDSSIKCLIATPASAKEGLTLTQANHTIFYDRSFSLDDYLQAQDRIHRISQINHVHVHNLIMQDSIDEWVDELLKLKEAASRLTTGDIDQEEFNKQSTTNINQLLQDILNGN